MSARWAPALLLAAACAPTTVPSSPAGPTTPAWREAHRALERLRAAARAGKPTTEQVKVRLRGPDGLGAIEARGALATDAGHALRMILLGPAGTTAMDLWIERDRYRMAIPPAGILARGDATTPARARRGMPVDFLRLWRLAPFDGRLLAAAGPDGSGRRTFVLREEDAIVTLQAGEPDGPIDAVRRTPLGVERIHASRLGCGEVVYHQDATGLDVSVSCTGAGASTPDPRAFDDPELAGGEP